MSTNPPIFKLISEENEVFRSYVYWSAVLILKMLLMAPLTAFYRFKNKAFINPEDCKQYNLKPILGDPDVERVRRAHRNDLENIIAIVLIGFFYVLTDPSKSVAINLFRVAGISRLLHTIVYAIYVVPMPTRGILYFFSSVATAYMTVVVILHFL